MEMTEDGATETTKCIEDPGSNTHSLLQDFERISQDYKELISEVHDLRSNYSLEVKKCEALKISIDSLMQEAHGFAENERLRKLNMETLANIAYQFECHSKYQRLKEELTESNTTYLDTKVEYEMHVVKLQLDLEVKIEEVEKQKSESNARIIQLSEELARHKTDAAERESKCQREIRELRDWIVVEQEEKNELLKKLQDAEMEMMMTRSKQAEHQKESISVRHVEALKQKLMKLRKENESLKRRLSTSTDSDLHCL